MARKKRKYPHKNKKGELECLICGEYFSHLGSHIWHKHGVLAREYKEEYELPYQMPLISETIREKKQDKWDPKSLDNLQTEKARKHRFKKGQTGNRRISDFERKKIADQLEKMNDIPPAHCPVCRMEFENVYSHLHMKHGMLVVDPEKEGLPVIN